MRTPAPRNGEKSPWGQCTLPMDPFQGIDHIYIYVTASKHEAVSAQTGRFSRRLQVSG